MGMEAPVPTSPQLPDLAIVSEVVRLADAAEAERFEQRPSTYPTYRFGDLDSFLRPTPARDELVARLRGLRDEVVAGLYGVYRAGDLPRPEPGAALERYRSSFELAMRPIHRPHGADDLEAKGPLADGLRRGIENLGLRLETEAAGKPIHHSPRPTGSPA